MSTPYSIVFTTVSSITEAEKIANILLSQQLAACIQVSQIKSFYTWQGQVKAEPEQLLTIKCQHQDFEAIQKCIKDNHSYEIPEIIQIPITAGLPEYLQWIASVTAKG
jgi:periplasmic divalent cation tolerance protein